MRVIALIEDPAVIERILSWLGLWHPLPACGPSSPAEHASLPHAASLVGIFVGPVVLAVTYTLLQDWVAEGEAVPERRAPTTVTTGRAAVDP